MNFSARNVKEMGMLGKTARLLVTFLLLVAAIPGTLAAQEQSWEYAVTPYLWFLSLDGDVTVKGHKADVDLDFDDIWDELNIAGMVEFKARKGHWGLYGDVIYANLGKDTSIGGVGVDPDMNVLWTNFGGLYRLGTWGLTDESSKQFPTLTVDTYLTLRYTYLDVELDFKNVPLPDVDGDQDWVEPVFGVRTIWDLSERWRLSLAGDIGGIAFGSDFAWGAHGLIGYGFGLFGHDNATLFGGYRALSQDYTDGHGNNKFEWDVTLHGPIAGLQITF